MRNTEPFTIPKATKSWKVGIVYAYSWHPQEIQTMVDGARSALEEAGIASLDIQLWEASGSFEVPLIGSVLAEQGKVDALIGLGIIVQGETHHAELLAQQAAHGIMSVQLVSRIPFAFEILYVDSLKEAQARSSGVRNKGREAAYAVLHSLEQLKRIRAA